MNTQEWIRPVGQYMEPVSAVSRFETDSTDGQFAPGIGS